MKTMTKQAQSALVSVMNFCTTHPKLTQLMFWSSMAVVSNAWGLNDDEPRTYYSHQPTFFGGLHSNGHAFGDKLYGSDKPAGEILSDCVYDSFSGRTTCI